MPIIFQDLESILFEWGQKVKIPKQRERTGIFVYDTYKKNIDNWYSKKIYNLFRSIDIKENVVIEENKETNKKKNIIIKKKSKL